SPDTKDRLGVHCVFTARKIISCLPLARSGLLDWAISSFLRPQCLPHDQGSLASDRCRNGKRPGGTVERIWNDCRFCRPRAFPDYPSFWMVSAISADLVGGGDG